MRFRILILFFTVFQTIYANKYDLPLFLLDYEGVMDSLDLEPNPFSVINEIDFANIVDQVIAQSDFQIIFMEDTFCMEDISLKDVFGSPYHYLHEGLVDEYIKYHPKVTDPYKTLNKIFQPKHYNVFYVSSINSKLHLFEEYKYLYVYFQDGANETRAEVLRRHDVIIKDVYFAMREISSGPVVAFYTGKAKPVLVKRRKFERTSPFESLRSDVHIDSKDFFFSTPSTLLRFNAKRVYNSGVEEIPKLNVYLEWWTPTFIGASLEIGKDTIIQFNFYLSRDTWSLSTLTWWTYFISKYYHYWDSRTEERFNFDKLIGRVSFQAAASWNRSYICSEPLLLYNLRDGSYLSIEKYQVEVPWKKYRGYRNLTLSHKGQQGGKNSGDFSLAVDCNPYFSRHIVTVLFVIAILLLSLFYGIILLFSCPSNDRFDDPDGRRILSYQPREDFMRLYN